jgi:lipoprotein-releasing system ATP-binding protein
MSEVLKLVKVVKSYTQAGTKFDVLNNINLAINSNEVIALVGSSGSGKSTLLHIAGLLDFPSSGDVFIAGEKIDNSSDDKATELRKTKIGFIYQFHHLIPEFNACENVMMPLLIAKANNQFAKDKAREILDLLGLSHRLNNFPSELSGGEQQRVAIARALIHSPKLLLADEPTGNLDAQNSEFVMNQLIGASKTLGTAMLIVTHNMALARKADRILLISSGIIENHLL